MSLFLIFFYIILSGVIVLSIVLLVETIASLFSAKFPLDTNNFNNISVTVLVPAHNEEKYIAETLESIIPQLKSTDNLVVIADNCGDRTADIAREKKVTVIERENKELRGKGYAIDFGLNYLRQNPPDVVVMVDADCIVTQESIKYISILAKEKQKPVQSTYLMTKPYNYNFRDQISSFALILKNQVRSLGLSYLKMPCLLNGSGMAFPWQILHLVSFANSKTVDDMQLGLDFAIAGFSPLYCGNSLVKGRLMEYEAATSQKSRWEHGHIETILTETPKLMIEAFKQKRLDLLFLALEVSIPPISLLLFFWLGLTLISLLIFILNITYIPLVLSLMAGVIIFMVVMIAWVKFGKEELPLLLLLKTPLYILWKIPIYIMFFFQRKSRWIRTERDN